MTIIGTRDKAIVVNLNLDFNERKKFVVLDLRIIRTAIVRKNGSKEKVFRINTLFSSSIELFK
jgi:hypothetical protein